MDSGSSAGRSPSTGSRLREHVEVSVPGAAQPGPDRNRADTLDDPVKPAIDAFANTFGDRWEAADSHRPNRQEHRSWDTPHRQHVLARRERHPQRPGRDRVGNGWASCRRRVPEAERARDMSGTDDPVLVGLTPFRPRTEWHEKTELDNHRYMPLIARGLGGLLDATLADLGIGGSWPSIHRVRPRVPLACAACGGSMHAKVSPRQLRFFAHDAARDECPLNGETPDHRLLKSAIAAAVRAAGWNAVLEAEGPQRRWRADVLATSPDGRRRVAWEAQLAHQHGDDTVARTTRYAGDGVEVVWVFDRPISRGVPTVRVQVEETSIVVAEPVVRLLVGPCESDRCVRYRDLPEPPPCPGHGRWEATTLPLELFVGLVCRGEIVWTDLAAADDTVDGKPKKAGPPRRALTRWWTSPVYLRRAVEVEGAQLDTDAEVAEVRARVLHEREAKARRRRALVEQLERDKQRHEANRAALRERQQRLTPVVVRHVTEQTGTRVWPLDGDPDYAMGVSILADGHIVAVICPVASRITDEMAEWLADVVVVVASERERRAIASRCRADQRIVVVADPPS